MPKEDSNFSFDEIKGLFDRIAAKSRCASPEKESIEEVLSHLNNIREWQHSKRQLAPAWSRRKKLKSALTEIHNYIAPLIQEIEQARSLMSGKLNDLAASELDALRNLQAAVSAVQGRSILLDSEPVWSHHKKWMELAPTIADLFRQAMAVANPGLTFGNSNAGPVATFVSEVIPRLTGESVVPGTVSNFLKKNPCQAGIL